MRGQGAGVLPGGAVSLGASARVQRVWGWKIAAYLFVAGAGAGAHAVGAAAALDPRLGSRAAGLFAMNVGAALVVLSILFLVWDLERPAGFLRVLRRTRRSWLSRGAWILLVFGALAGTNVLLGAPAVLTAVSLAAAVAVATYTGVLIGTIMARPIWNTPILPVLFLASALSTGIALVGVCERLVPAGAALGRDLSTLGASLRTGHLLLLAGELLLLYFYLSIVASRTPDGVALLLRGPLAGPFWCGVVLVGLVLPLGLEALVAPVGHAPLAGTLAALAVLAGGFCLRWVILAAGVRARVYLGVPFVIRPEV